MRESENTSGGRTERGRERISSADSVEPGAGLELMNWEITTQAEIKSWTLT